MKKLTAVLLALLLTFSLASGACAEAEPPAPDEVIEEYTNMLCAGCIMDITSSGTASVCIECYGKAGTTHISSRLYLERWTGSNWVRVSFNGMSEICDGASADYLIKVHSTTVGSGIYRATVIYTVTRNGTDEVVTMYSNLVTH